MATRYQTLVRPPSITPSVMALIALCTAVYLLLAYLGIAVGGTPSEDPQWPLLRAIALVPSEVDRGHIWQFATYMFAHTRGAHLLFNMLALFFFGSRVERRLGLRRFLGFYLACGVFAGLCSYLFAKLPPPLGHDPSVPVLGASGAVYALLTMWALWWPNEEVLLWGLVPVKVKWLVLALIFAIFLGLLALPGGIAHEAHLAGCIAALGYWWWTERRPPGFGRRSIRRRRLRLVKSAEERFRSIMRDI